MTASSKGSSTSSSPAHVSIACWFDLLGYGRMIDTAGFDPAHANATRPIARLRAFHQSVAKHSSTGFPTLVMNDGAVAYSDVEQVRSDKVWRFIERCWALYGEATVIDKRNGGPGLRAVIAVGLRAKGSSRGIVAQDGAITSIIDDLAAGRITRKDALAKTRKVRRVFDIVPQLQANFAFTRAYEAEQSGTKGGFLGPNLFLDVAVFKQGVPAWIRSGPSKPWRPKKASLSTSFIAINKIDNVPADLAHAALRTGRELLHLLSYPGGQLPLTNFRNTIA
jgi:hypothetical protein